ncbi:GNAT family N-acetyltransferase [Streptomyces sp. NBC_00237]|uniref:GNAT family N-acetyltransferase n=1 Tax=Streptomyces sp. NBC_00237 TaxID=2975687 RepID=UPI0022506486|nr:GNAT family N-acetyltransferase [Streptomyces sp. NBC_00237]MCX5203327.1 GNAT family N-acetyltransferase [Streptomyces sp. NBC_00237]
MSAIRPRPQTRPVPVGAHPAIRLALADELPLLQDIERAAGEPFRELGMTEVADDEPPPLDLLAAYQLQGHAWVFTDPADLPAAYLIWQEVDGAAHIDQVSVHPRLARRGAGRALIERLDRESGYGALTLTTFAQVPWNAPYYARLGFRTLDGGELTLGLREIVAEEASMGLDRWPRVCMRREASVRTVGQGFGTAGSTAGQELPRGGTVREIR